MSGAPHKVNQPIGCGTLMLSSALYIVLYATTVFALGFLQPFTEVPRVSEGVELMTVAFYPIPFFILHCFFVTSRFIVQRIRDGAIVYPTLLREAALAAGLGAFFGTLLLLRLSSGDPISFFAAIIYPLLFGITGGLAALVIGRILVRISEEAAHTDKGRGQRHEGAAYVRFLALGMGLFGLVCVLYPALFNYIWAHYLETRHSVQPNPARSLLSLEGALYALPGTIVVGYVIVAGIQIRGAVQNGMPDSLPKYLVADFLRGALLAVTVEGGYWLSLVVFESSVDPLGFVIFRTLIFSLFCGFVSASLSAVLLVQRPRKSLHRGEQL